MEIGDIFRQNGGRKQGPIPTPNVAVRTGEETGDWTEEQIRGVICNPIYAGINPFPPLVSDETWVRTAALMISKEGAEQFLVNVLFALRASFENISVSAND